ncbi:MAG: DUF1501 domain-containing protein [Deltaproteobacteria bacterium]|nr:DUF1501 domain-containing protein [Deltaproteobacteria bacterium]
MKRRSFLGASAALSAGLLVPGRARASFGTFPSSASALLLPEAQRVESVLEVYLYGGLSPWETLYFVERYGRDNGSFYYAYDQDVLGGVLGDGDLLSNQSALAACGLDEGGATTPEFFATDELGNDVMTGPFAFGLRERSDLVDRMRLVVQRHELLPHEAAVPYALTGKRVGQPAMAGLGAQLQRFFIEQDRERGVETRRTPYSYVLASAAAVPSDNTAAFTAAGTHPGFARPLRINVDAAARLEQLLARQGVKDQRAVHDDLVELYVQRYRQRLRYDGVGTPLRSPRFAELSLAVNALRDVDAIQEILDPALLDPTFGDICASGELRNIPDQSLKLAANLLTRTEERARYVCVVDSGLTVASGGGGYDTHTEQTLVTVRNFTNLMRSLAQVVNRPDENDPTKLSLDKTLIILNTEFGRTPTLQEGPGGRNHHPAGYVTAFLGGPVPGRTIFGAIDDAGAATRFATPAENRMGALLALGIWPYDNDAFVVADHAEPVSEEEGAASTTQNVLGVQL